ncbi:hypothetical protein [Granulicella mallensis]|uniref:Uncharacterized protein n=1 Tax=Granulicella mallensis (strain ATCC BAA-1857 / DSM 23137 / MP5ACTX8) TaxID=682795 RepID=G8NS08_GRAMM|nr:hypothetical protein [Granulicella mallensis]AEU36216.1 hypothetical protein AciX8_1880 [Granulicella mallensis MP5ACTX8]
MNRLDRKFCFGLALFASAFPAFAQTHTRGAKMTVDTADQACVQLHDNNKWTSSITDLDGVGTNYTLSTFVANGHLTLAAPTISSSDHPHATGYGNGFKWDSTDETTGSWSPQGFTIGSVNGDEMGFASWNWSGASPSHGTRLSIVDVADLSNVVYRDIQMVLPTGPGTYEAIAEHAGGIAAFTGGRYLYVTEGSGFHVFDLNNIRKVNTTACTASDGTPIFGKNSAGDYCAGGYEFMVPQVAEYSVPSTTESGTAISATCNPKFSWGGYDWRRATNYLLSGEYCGAAADGSACNGDSSFLNGRMYMWPVASTGELAVDTAGYVSPFRVYYMNESDVQGIASDNNLDSDGVSYPTDTYYLASTYENGFIYRVGENVATESWSYDAGTAPYHPEGMYATSTPNMWVLTEGGGGSSDPAGEGRSVFYLHQGDIR